MRQARLKGDNGTGIYHCLCRIIERRFVFDRQLRKQFVSLLRALESFSGIRVLTHTVLSNHFHLVLQVPPRRDVPDKEFIRRLGALYTPQDVRTIKQILERLRKDKQDKAADKFKVRYTYRMYNLSEFMKTLKQRFSQGYNRQHNRHGTMWEGRFKSVLIQAPHGRNNNAHIQGAALAMVCAYVDLNAVRAGIVSDPKDYRYSGYGEAVGGNRKAREGIRAVMGMLGMEGSWKRISAGYRKLLYAGGGEKGLSPEGTVLRVGFKPEEIQKVLDEGGKLPLAEILRCRVRYFSDGLVLGSREYVNGIFRKHRSRFGLKRKTGAREMKYGEWSGLCTMRDLRVEVVSRAPP